MEFLGVERETRAFSRVFLANMICGDDEKSDGHNDGRNGANNDNQNFKRVQHTKHSNHQKIIETITSTAWYGGKDQRQKEQLLPCPSSTTTMIHDGASPFPLGNAIFAEEDPISENIPHKILSYYILNYGHGHTIYS